MRSPVLTCPLRTGSRSLTWTSSQDLAWADTGYLLDGTKFDSSYDKKGEPFKFRMGKGKVIGGWEATVGGMRPGQRVIVKIPSKYAYGKNGVVRAE